MNRNELDSAAPNAQGPLHVKVVRIEAKPLGLIGRIIAGIIGVIVLVGAFFLSLLVFAAVIVIAALVVVYVLWNLRKYDAYRARAANDERIIDGEVLETDSHDPPRS